MEYFDVCDAAGEPTGAVVARDVAHREGIRHRTAHVWVVRRVGGRWQVLLQKRAAHKDSFPGKYDTSSAGHVRAGSVLGQQGFGDVGQDEVGGVQVGHAVIQGVGVIAISYANNISFRHSGHQRRAQHQAEHHRDDFFHCGFLLQNNESGSAGCLSIKTAVHG